MSIDPAAPPRRGAPWNEPASPQDEVGLLLHRSHLLGADLRVTNFAGGNTSCKVPGVDPVTGDAITQLWIKGSGGDLGTLRREGLAVLDTARVRALERDYRGVEHEDEQATLLAACVCAPGAAPSIDTPLHALLPAAHIDHVHPDAVIALATVAGGRPLVDELYGGTVGWLDWQRPGFDLALRLRDLVAQRPDLRGVVLGGHGLICWADTARACYENTLDIIERAEAHIARVQSTAPFGAARVADLDSAARALQAQRILPLLRGLCGDGAHPRVAHFRDDAAVLEFVRSERAPALALQGTSCPDHFLRTKRTPLLLDLPPDADPQAARSRIEAALDAYRETYASYYRRFATGNSPPMRSPDPVVVLWPGVGMVTLAASKRDARIAAEFYVNAIAVMRGATVLGGVDGYRGLDEAEAFRIEYWELEEAKLRRMPPPRPLSGRVALVTGGTGGIGRAVARRLSADGACVVVADLDLAEAEAVAGELGEQGLGVACDVADEEQVDGAFAAATLHFGGVDVLVNNAGISVSRPLLEHSAADYERLHRVIDRGSFLMSRAFARQAMVQGRGGDIVYVVSKNAVAAQPDNVGYASAKAAQLHQMRVLAAELGQHGVRVNAVNPDAVVQGSKIFAGGWGADRAARYGVDPERLGEYYAQRTLLRREVLPDDVAAAVAVLLGVELGRTTGAIIPVDGGVSSAFLR